LNTTALERTLTGPPDDYLTGSFTLAFLPVTAPPEPTPG
jgi:hypothetical protein